MPPWNSMNYKLAPQERFCGAPIGVMQLDDIALWIPGSVGHAETFSLPVRYRTVPGLTASVVVEAEAANLEAAVVETAVALVDEGARMITANCGFAARFQNAVSDAVDVPVLLSSLLLAPFLESMLPASKKLGVLAGTPTALTEEFLAASNLTSCVNRGRIVLAGLEDRTAFLEAFGGYGARADIPAVAESVVESAKSLLARHPDIGILLLECSEFPPYAAAVQQATGVPVFDFTSMIEFFAAGLRRKPFEGGN